MSHPFLYSKILVADDEVEVCNALKQFLEEEKFRVDLAHDGEGALAKLDEFKPHCVLLDVRMPYLNGVDALKMIKFRQPDTEVVMVTAVANIKVAEECMRNGAFGYVSKPVDLDYLLKEINAALQRRKENLEKQRVDPEESERLREEHKNVKSAVQALNEELFRALKFPIDLAGFTNAEFACHSKNVSWLAGELGRQLGLEQSRLCELAGLYHDIGKLCLPRLLWQGPAEKWSASERKVYQRFPVYGQDIVQSHFHLTGLGSVIRHQCENLDGTGFPDRLPAVKIPLESKIVAVANAFDEALVQANLRNIEQDIAEGANILEALGAEKDKKFDPAVLEALAQVVNQRKYKAPKEMQMQIPDLTPKMVLSRNVMTKSGKLVLARGTTLTPERIEKIDDFGRIEPISLPIHILADPNNQK